MAEQQILKGFMPKAHQNVDQKERRIINTKINKDQLQLHKKDGKREIE